MVRGRRVRAVVACTRNDDCCSPNPKRRDQKININEKLSHAITPKTATQSITEFFQAVCDIDLKNVDMKEVSEDIKALRSARRKGTPTKLVLNEAEATEVIFTSLNGLCEEKNIVINNNFPSTPIVNKLKKTCDDVNSPPTPHRIELRSDNNEEQTKQKTEMPKPLIVPNKMQRKLNLNQEMNKLDKKKDNNNKLTDYFPVRRSVRKTKKIVLEEKQRSLEMAVRSGSEDGLKVWNFDGKGRGVVAVKDFEKGEFVVEYSGDLIDTVEAKEREDKYAQDQNTGCYMYYFKHNEQQYCIDATAESGKLGRLVNHSRNGNLTTRTIMVDNKPRLVLIAKEDIKSGQEVLYDYGDRSKESLRHHPWLAY